ncbi:hypothetical protein RCH17_003592 [Arthrobacter sp. MP_M7]|nr:hypothetical protein [Arthrobacter sp. MP_M4]MEC5204760.1 hypothetical protein [Arthrobacter sp. MP_M7]
MPVRSRRHSDRGATAGYEGPDCNLGNRARPEISRGNKRRRSAERNLGSRSAHSALVARRARPAMMGNQNDKQRRCFWSFMDWFGRRGMTRVHLFCGHSDSNKLPDGTAEVLADKRSGIAAARRGFKTRTGRRRRPKLQPQGGAQQRKLEGNTRAAPANRMTVPQPRKTSMTSARECSGGSLSPDGPHARKVKQLGEEDPFLPLQLQTPPSTAPVSAQTGRQNFAAEAP